MLFDADHWKILFNVIICSKAKQYVLYDAIWCGCLYSAACKLTLYKVRFLCEGVPGNCGTKRVVRA